VVTENSIRAEIVTELADHVTIPKHAWDSRFAVALADVAAQRDAVPEATAPSSAREMVDVVTSLQRVSLGLEGENVINETNIKTQALAV